MMGKLIYTPSLHFYIWYTPCGCFLVGDYIYFDTGTIEAKTYEAGLPVGGALRDGSHVINTTGDWSHTPSGCFISLRNDVPNADIHFMTGTTKLNEGFRDLKPIAGLDQR